jgi:hypothetical protein
MRSVTSLLKTNFKISLLWLHLFHDVIRINFLGRFNRQ